jgi:hypothetical protein
MVYIHTSSGEKGGQAFESCVGGGCFFIGGGFFLFLSFNADVVFARHHTKLSWQLVGVNLIGLALLAMFIFASGSALADRKRAAPTKPSVGASNEPAAPNLGGPPASVLEWTREQWEAMALPLETAPAWVRRLPRGEVTQRRNIAKFALVEDTVQRCVPDYPALRAQVRESVVSPVPRQVDHPVPGCSMLVLFLGTLGAGPLLAGYPRSGQLYVLDSISTFLAMVAGVLAASVPDTISTAPPTGKGWRRIGALTAWAAVVLLLLALFTWFRILIPEPDNAVHVVLIREATAVAFSACMLTLAAASMTTEWRIAPGPWLEGRRLLAVFRLQNALTAAVQCIEDTGSQQDVLRSVWKVYLFSWWRDYYERPAWNLHRDLRVESQRWAAGLVGRNRTYRVLAAAPDRESMPALVEMLSLDLVALATGHWEAVTADPVSVRRIWTRTVLPRLGVAAILGAAAVWLPAITHQSGLRAPLLIIAVASLVTSPDGTGGRVVGLLTR